MTRWKNYSLLVSVASLFLAPAAFGTESRILNTTSATEPIPMSAVSLRQLSLSGTENNVAVINQDTLGQERKVAIVAAALPLRWYPVSAASVSPSQLTFGSVPVGTSSAANSATLSNNGRSKVTISGVTLTGDFAQTNTCGTSLAAGASCTISVKFSPTATGVRSGTLSIADSATGSPQRVTLSGTGIAPAASASPNALSFGSQLLSTTSAASVVTLSNAGTASLTISGVTVTGDFAQTNTCGTSLAAGSSCTISVKFSPTATGLRSGTLSIADSATGSPQQVSLSGTGIAAAASISPATWTFGSQVLSTTSSASVVTLSNAGTASLTISGVTVTGDFAQTNTCGTGLAAGSSCTISVKFSPTATGLRSGMLSIADSATGSPQQVSLYGTGATAGSFGVSPTSLALGSVGVGQTGSKTVTLTNSGGSGVIVNSVSISGAGLGISGLSTPFTLGASQSSTFTVTFTPAISGAVTGTVYLTDNSPTTSVSIPVTATGVGAPSHDVMVQWTASTSNVSGYNTYRGTVTGGPYTKLTSTPIVATTYDDQSVQAGQKYYYVVTSVAADSTESGYSNEASATVPTP